MTADDPGYVADERRDAPAVREWNSQGPNAWQFKRDRAGLARALWRLQMPKHEIAEAVGVHWAQVDQVLQGGAVIVLIHSKPVEIVWVPVLTREGLREMARQNCAPSMPRTSRPELSTEESAS